VRVRASWIAASFVRSAADVRAVRRAVARLGGRCPIVAKLERQEAIENLEEILAASDAAMIARGDLGVELGPEQVPVVQQRIIHRAHAHGIPVVTATQMLESMTRSPRPTRAEASDVANAVFDDTDALMLSAETATGRYPREAVAMMARIVEAAEGSGVARRNPPLHRAWGVPESVADAAVRAATDLNLPAIAAFTEYGRSAQLVSMFRPACPVYGCSANDEALERLALCWGVWPCRVPRTRSLETLVRQARRTLRRAGAVRGGDVFALVAGTPVGRPGRTNLLRLVTVE
jgi:pyruvate kinase